MKQIKSCPPTMLSLPSLLDSAGLFNLDPLNLIRYVRKSQLGRKLLGFTEKFDNMIKKKEEEKETKGVNAFLKNMEKEKKKKVQ